MTRRPLPIALAVLSAILIVFGRVNRESSWGNSVLLVGFAVLVVAGAVLVVQRR